MSDSHVVVVLGTRPDAVKLAPAVHQLARQRASYKVSVVSTAQHRQMLDQVLRLTCRASSGRVGLCAGRVCLFAAGLHVAAGRRGGRGSV